MAQTEIELTDIRPWERPINDFREFKHYNDMGLVRVRHGQGRLVDGVNIDTENGGALFREISLDDQPLIQMRDTENPGSYGYGKVAPGAGLEHMDCDEIKKIDDAFRCGKPYRGFEDAFEKLKPLFSLLNDGYYMLVDTYLCPTDGGNRVFWDIDSTPRELPAFNRRTDFFDSDYAQSPHYCYPSKWPSYYSEDEAELWDAEEHDEREVPRAIGYAVSSNMVLLLDGHYKAMNHLGLSDLVPCLVIIPHMKDREHYGKTCSCFADIKIKRELLNSAPPFIPITKKDFTLFPVEGRDFYERSTLEKKWMLYPPVELHYGEALSFLSTNAARLVNYDAEIFDSIFSADAKTTAGNFSIKENLHAILDHYQYAMEHRGGEQKKELLQVLDVMERFKPVADELYKLMDTNGVTRFL